MRVQSKTLQVLFGTDARNQTWHVGTRQTKLLVFARGGKKLVGVGVHSGVYANSHRLHATLCLGGGCDALKFNLAVNDNRTDARGNGSTDFRKRLVVTV
ncbi:unannotated protein [freshwater metagenome]|uniref:Unannotated protein n=1 Tax=freshwater metagenome TaxID=449393 RepID=A0A6J6BAS5_9ZZZZ